MNQFELPHSAIVTEVEPDASGWGLQYSDPDRAHQLAAEGATSSDPWVAGWSELMLASHCQRFVTPADARLHLEAARRAIDTVDTQPIGMPAVSGRGDAVGRAFIGPRARWVLRALEANQAFVEGNLAAAMSISEALVADLPPHGHEADLHLVYAILSFCHKRLGNFEAGLRWLYTDLALVREHDLKPQLAIVLLNLSAYLMSIDEWREADVQLKEAATLASQFNNAVLQRRIELNLALCARFLDDDQRALEMTQRALADPRTDAGSAFSLYGNAASLYAKLGRLDEARDAQSRAWTLARRDPTPLWLANCHYCDAQIAIAEGKSDRAIESLQAASSYANQVTEVQVAVLPPILRLLAESYAHRGDFQRAYEAHRRFYAEHESRLGYTQQARFFAERTRHEVETMRLERDQAVALQRQSELAKAQLAEVNAQLATHIAEVEALQKQLEEQAIRDSLTGLFNRRYWDATLPSRIAFAQRTKLPLAVAELDLDHFKRLNDTHGHAAGDEVLREFGALLANRARASDLVCRVGGEEFCILFDNVTREAAVARIEEILAAFSAMKVNVRSAVVSGLTFSAGVALFPNDGREPEDLVRRADTRLYQAKRAGRAKVASE